MKERTNHISEAKKRVEECFLIAEKHYGHPIERCRVNFDLKGKTAGTANWATKTIRLNRDLLVKNKEHFLSVTCPHEVAHIIQRQQDEKRGFQSQSHGKEWKSIMIGCFKLPAKRCHNYDLSHIEKKTKPYLYSCTVCSKEFQFGAIRHKRINENENRYQCKCGGKLNFSKLIKARSRNLESKGMRAISLD